jgi:cell division protein FtsN
MANTGRSTYEPPDDIYVFDGAEDDDDVEGSRLPLLIVIALFVLAAFAGVVYLAYTQGVARGRSDVPRIIAAQPGPAKVAANEEQGASGPGSFRGLKIYQQPAPSDEAQDRQAATPPPSPDQAQTVAPETTPVTPARTEAPKTETPAKAETPPREPPLSVARSLVAPAAPPVSRPTPPPAPAAEQVATAEPAPAPAKAPAAGTYVLQIGAYKSDEEASTAWRTYHAKHAGLLAGYSEDVKKVDLGEKGTWYRLRVGSFADKDAAKALCAKLTADGGACFPAK